MEKLSRADDEKFKEAKVVMDGCGIKIFLRSNLFLYLEMTRKTSGFPIKFAGIIGGERLGSNSLLL